MDSAMDILTKATVEAEQLWMIDEVDKDGYSCRGCSVKAIPCSYQPHNKVRPYFKVIGKHDSDCDVEGEEKLVGKGKNERLSTARGDFPIPYPSKLVLRDYRPVLDPDPAPAPAILHIDGNDGSRGRSSNGKNDSTRGREANTIRPICRSFINYPHDRDLPLSIPGIEGATYISIFKKLNWGGLQAYPGQKLLYSAIRWNKAVETDEYLEVLLDAGVREGGKLKVGHKIHIDWSNWSKAKRTFVKNDLETARLEAIEESEKKSKKKAYLFFIGQQDADDIAIFHVTDHRLICCIVDEITYPKLSY